MTLREIIEVAALLSVFAMALQMIILFFVALGAIKKIKKEILPLFTEKNFQKILDVIKGLNIPIEADEDRRMPAKFWEQVRPLIVNNKILAWYIVDEGTLFIKTNEGENEGQLIDRLAQTEKFTMASYLNLSKQEIEILESKYNRNC